MTVSGSIWLHRGSRALELLETVFICIRRRRCARSGRRAAGCRATGLTRRCGDCSQDSDRRDRPPAASSVVASTDVWGSVASAVAGDHAIGEVDRSPAPSPTRTRSRPLPPTPPRSPTRHWSSTTAAATTTGSTTCSSGHPDVDDRRRLLAAARHRHAAGQRTRLLRPRAPPRRSPSRSPSGSPRPMPTHADDYRANAAEFGEAGRRDRCTSSARSARPHPGASVVATEPVAHYLLVNAGITDKTPAGLR